FLCYFRLTADDRLLFGGFFFQAEDGIRDRRVADARPTKERVEALRRAEGSAHRVLLRTAAAGAADDVLAHHDHGRVSLHRLAHGLADRVDHRERALGRHGHLVPLHWATCSGYT